jgi:uncharacterized protein
LVGGEPLIVIAFFYKHARVEAARLLLDAGGNVNAADKYGYTALMEAASWNNYDDVAFLLERGADPRLKTVNGETVLTVVGISSLNDAKLIRLLISAGADPCVDSGGRKAADNIAQMLPREEAERIASECIDRIK